MERMGRKQRGRRSLGSERELEGRRRTWEGRATRGRERGRREKKWKGRKIHSEGRRGIEAKKKGEASEGERNGRQKHNLETFSPLSYYISFLYFQPSVLCFCSVCLYNTETERQGTRQTTRKLSFLLSSLSISLRISALLLSPSFALSFLSYLSFPSSDLLLSISRYPVCMLFPLYV